MAPAVKNNDLDEILNLLELVVGAAVMCEDKAVFIPKIFELNDLSQAVLKGLVEQAMGRAEDIVDEGKGDSATGRSLSGDEVDAASAGVEDLRVSASMTEKEQLRCAVAYNVTSLFPALAQPHMWSFRSSLCLPCAYITVRAG